MLNLPRGGNFGDRAFAASGEPTNSKVERKKEADVNLNVYIKRKQKIPECCHLKSKMEIPRHVHSIFCAGKGKRHRYSGLFLLALRQHDKKSST